MQQKSDNTYDLISFTGKSLLLLILMPLLRLGSFLKFLVHSGIVEWGHILWQAKISLTMEIIDHC